MNNSIIPLKEAGDRFQVENIDTFRRGMKRAGCIITIAGVDLIDMDNLQQKAVEKSQSNLNRKANRVKRATNPVGLLKARIKKYPTWLEGKRAAIEAVRLIIATASSNYERNQAHKKLDKLQRDLTRMGDNFKRDQDKLNSILNADYGNFDSRQSTEAVEADVNTDLAEIVDSDETAEDVHSIEEPDHVDSLEFAESSNGAE